MTAASTREPAIGPAYLRLVLLGALIGIPAAFLAAVFLAAVHDLEHVLWHDLPSALGRSSPPWYLVIGLPVAGAVVVLIARKLLPGDGGHSPREGLAEKPTPVSFAPGVALAAIGTLCFGAVLGPEAPVIALGSVVGVAVTRYVRVGREGTAVLSSAGSFSAMSALFGGPIVAGLLLVEGGISMGAALLPTLLPGLTAAAIGYVIFVGFGTWGGLNAPGLLIPNLPAYHGTHLLDLLIGLAVGIVSALSITGIRRLASGVDRGGPKWLGTAGLLLAGGLVVGVLAEVADLLGANS